MFLSDMSKIIKKIRKYVIKHDQYEWHWNGERWTVNGPSKKIYTKNTLPMAIKYMKLVKNGEEVAQWYYEGEGRKAFIARYYGES